MIHPDKSPLTGGIAGASSGGSFGAELKYAGYDAIIREGKAPRPVYIWIKNDKIEIRRAAHVWGKWGPRHHRHPALRDRRRGRKERLKQTVARMSPIDPWGGVRSPRIAGAPAFGEAADGTAG